MAGEPVAFIVQVVMTLQEENNGSAELWIPKRSIVYEEYNRIIEPHFHEEAGDEVPTSPIGPDQGT